MSLYKRITEKWMLNESNELAVICDDVRYTYVDFDKKVKEIANELEKCGIRKYCKVAIMNEHPLYFVLFFCALIYLEAIPMPIFSKMGILKLEGLVKHYEINNIIISDECARGSFCGGLVSENSILNARVCRYSSVIDEEIMNARLILFTSGTTSIPKAVMLSETNILSNVDSISEYLRLENEDRILLVKDLSHSSSIVGELLVGLRNKCTIVLSTKLLTPNTIMRIITSERISVFFAVPTLLENIMAYPRLNVEQLDNIRILNFYGASMHEQEIENLYKYFRKANVIYSYGQTEASPRVTYIEKKDLLRKRKSCGKPISGVSVFIIDEKGNEVGEGIRGEIVVSGPNIMIGYYKDIERTQRTVVDGKLHTGDVGYKDSDNFLYVTGRRDNMLISSGKNIYPEEIEGVLSSNAQIVEALVVGKEKENSIVDLYAFVVPKSGVEVDYNKLFEYCKQNLESYKIPKEFIIVDKLEKTPSGKIIRKEGSSCGNKRD